MASAVRGQRRGVRGQRGVGAARAEAPSARAARCGDERRDSAGRAAARAARCEHFERGAGTALRSQLLGSARVWCAGSAAGRPGAAVQGYEEAREGGSEEGRALCLGAFRSGVPATAAPWRPVGAPPCLGCYITEGAEVAVGTGSIHPLLGVGPRGSEMDVVAAGG